MRVIYPRNHAMYHFRRASWQRTVPFMKPWACIVLDVKDKSNNMPVVFFLQDKTYKRKIDSIESIEGTCLPIHGEGRYQGSPKIKIKGAASRPWLGVTVQMTQS